MFAWWRRWRREEILKNPFPEAWHDILRRNVGHIRFLGDEELKSLEDLVQVFVAEKNFVGCGGLEIDDEIRVTIAANACMLLLGLDHDLYIRVESILVYPSTVQPPARHATLTSGSATIVADSLPILGEAQFRGPVVLVWDAVTHGSRHPTIGHNVVFHEFAHKLDMLDNAIDGTPPLSDSAQYDRWSKACGKVYFEMKRKVAAGEPTFLDPYGATSEAEFFAVATEFFFERPQTLEQEHPALYGVLQEFYHQDPARRQRFRVLSSPD